MKTISRFPCLEAGLNTAWTEQNKWHKLFYINILRNGVKISFQFQADYFGVSRLSFEANSCAI